MIKDYNHENDPIPIISGLYIDLLKMCYEGIGYYLLDTNNEIEYRNYFAANPFLCSSEFSGGDLEVGEYRKNPSNWDINSACNWIIQNSHSSSQHQCARYVRMAIEAGGISTNGRPGWAWQYVKYLPTIGFKCINYVDRDNNGVNGSYTPAKGDIAVYTKGVDTSVPGHICMWTGSQWISDFKQHNMIVYQNTPKAYIFRFM